MAIGVSVQTSSGFLCSIRGNWKLETGKQFALCTLQFSWSDSSENHMYAISVLNKNGQLYAKIIGRNVRQYFLTKSVRQNL